MTPDELPADMEGRQEEKVLWYNPLWIDVSEIVKARATLNQKGDER
jgi:hypothetical protein